MAAMNPPVHRLLAAATLLAAFVLAGCAAPTPETSPTADGQSGGAPPLAAAAQVPTSTAPTPVTPPTAPVHAPRNKPAPPMSAPLPPELVPEPSPRAPSQVDLSCKVDADCAVRNIGSSHRPTCVNIDSPTNVSGVQAGGVKPIDHCRCDRGRCKAEIMLVNGVQGEAPPAETR